MPREALEPRVCSEGRVVCRVSPDSKETTRLSGASRFLRSAKVDGPVGAVDEAPPTLVLRVAEFHGEQRAATRLDRLPDQVHAGLVGRPAPFSHVAAHARADDVFPTRDPASAPRDDVIERQLARGEAAAAVLALVTVAGKHIAAIESQSLARAPIAGDEADHPRSRGGITSWENIVCACVGCNVRKGGRTPHEARMQLIRQPVKPRRSPLLSVKLGNPKYESWRSFVDSAYWTVDLR